MEFAKQKKRVTWNYHYY